MFMKEQRFDIRSHYSIYSGADLALYKAKNGGRDRNATVVRDEATEIVHNFNRWDQEADAKAEMKQYHVKSASMWPKNQPTKPISIDFKNTSIKVTDPPVVGIINCNKIYHIIAEAAITLTGAGSLTYDDTKRRRHEKNTDG